MCALLAERFHWDTAKCLEQNRWDMLNLLFRARDSKGNLIIMPKEQGKPYDSREEWFAAWRQCGVPEWQINELWADNERLAQTMNGTQSRTP